MATSPPPSILRLLSTEINVTRALRIPLISTHPIEVAELLWSVGGIWELLVLVAALLHNTLAILESLHMGSFWIEMVVAGLRCTDMELEKCYDLDLANRKKKVNI